MIAPGDARNVTDLVASAAADVPGRPALVEPQRGVLRWGDVERRVAATAAALRAGGVEQGDRVALVLPNGADFAVTFWAALRIGAVAVPVNPAYTAREMAHIVADSRPRRCIADPSVHAVVSAAAGDVPVDPPLRAPGDAGDAAVADPVGGDDDLAVICYTSGTTGRPKGAMLSHRNFLANLDDLTTLPRLALTPDDVLLGVVPFFHIFGMNVLLNAAAATHGAVLVVDRFNPVTTLEAVVEAGATVLYGAPPVFAAWSAMPVEVAPRLPSVRAAVSGADALPVRTWHAFAERWGVEILEGYGLTETAPVLTSNAASPAVRPGTVGHPLPRVRLRIVGPAGEDLPLGATGEVVASGPNVFRGYWNADDATRKGLRDGWFATGDLGRVDDDGYLTIAGRLKDMVIVSGFNVYPREVESVLTSHPDVAEAAVVGEPDDRTGERVVAVVVARPQRRVDPAALLAFARTQLARYKLPREIRVVDALPRTSLGKVRRDVLRSRPR